MFWGSVMSNLTHPDQGLHFHGGTEASNHLNLNWALCSSLGSYWWHTADGTSRAHLCCFLLERSFGQ